MEDEQARFEKNALHWFAALSEQGRKELVEWLYKMSQADDHWSLFDENPMMKEKSS